MKSKLLRKGIAALSVLAMTAQLGFAIPAGAQPQNAVGGDAGASAELSEAEALKVEIGKAVYERMSVTIPVTVTGEGTADINVFVAEYDENGVMTKSHVVSEAVSAGSKDIVVRFVDEYSNAYKVVAYAWDKNMKSYSNAQVVIDRTPVYKPPIENDSFTANDNPTVMVSSISQAIDGDDNLVYLIKGISYGGEFVYKTMSTTAVYNTTENAPLFNLKKYNYQKVWSAEEDIQDDIYNYVKPGDVFVLKSTGSIIEGMVKIGDADYITHNRKPVWTGKDSSVASWQGYSMASRECWLFGLVGDIIYGDEARVNMLDPVSLDMGSTVAIDSSKIFNLCEVYLGSGNDIRTRVSKDAITADDLIPYDPQTGEGDLILAKAHRSSLKDVYVYRIGSKIVDYKTEFKAEDISFDEKAYTDYNSFGEAVLGTQKLYVRNPHNEEYSLNKDVQVSVNGVIVPAEERVKALNSFIADNPAGDVTLVDVAETDGVYDRIEISYHLDAVALSAAESGEMYKIILDKYQSLNGVSLSTIMSISKNKNISVSLADGTPMSITDIQEGDVLSVEYDVVNYPGDVNNSEFFRITVCRDTVNGKVTSFDRTGSVSYYEIDGNKYALSQGLIDSLEIGANYAAKLDVYGRIVEAVNTDDMTIKNGIVDRVYINNATEEQLIRIVQENGIIGTYPARKDEVYNNALAICYNADGSEKDISERVVSYKMNSRGEISIINSVEDTVRVSDVYYANAKRIGNYKIGSDSVIVIEDTDGSISSDEVLSGDVSLLTDGEAYEVLMAGKSNADASYRFIVILGGFTGIGMKSPLAAVDSYSLGVDEEGNTVYRLGLIGQGMSILTDLYVSNEVDEAAVTALKKGDLITYSLNGAGMINSFKTVFGGVNGSLDNTPENMYKDYAINASDNVSGDEEAWEQTFYNMPDKISVPERWSKSLTTDREGFVRVAFGPVVGKGADYIELAKVLKDGDTYYTPGNDIFRLNYGTNTNIMVCDFGESRSQRIQSGSNGSIIKTTLPRAVKDNNGTIYWQTPAGSSQESISSLELEQYYAFVKMVDYEVTDIYFIAPNVY